MAGVATNRAVTVTVSEEDRHEALFEVLQGNDGCGWDAFWGGRRNGQA
jgi:hypothetical protein